MGKFVKGENLVRITLDINKEVVELDDENNVQILSFIPKLPDLRITFMELDTWDGGDRTSEVALNFTLKNEGQLFPFQIGSSSKQYNNNKFGELTLSRGDGYNFP